ncbi:mRNA interferase YafQ [Flavobacterium sp. CG_9.10]|uniref:type II toxin-antitoxin system YafQ family toxin n=1 Tax=Flavobacterium sp. CG_9.10 TaxID=2787729 RepID=UPI0018CA8669|nr:type II toxin-antitoxin system YafQ family toxin [Flavobacterium sp. CG_9.10]MBG6111498.1 mRNA interferase YafQ [Flavobacterium sp. CG_9.10]
MSYCLEYSGQFKKDAKLCKKRNWNLNLLENVVEILLINGELPPKNKPHTLSGNYSGFWECHIKPDWLLIWKQDDQNKTIYLDRTGSHSDLF